MSGDTRLWMYRKGEARLFAHPDHVPGGENWGRFPVGEDETEDIPEQQTQAPKGAALSPEEKLDRMSRQRLMKVAADCGVRFAIGWSKAQFKQAIIEVLHDKHP
jgi:hypothetical protein